MTTNNQLSDPENACQEYKKILTRCMKGLSYYIMFVAIMQMMVSVAAVALPCQLGIYFNSFTLYANGFWIAVPVS